MYEVFIGLEVHIHLKTASKAFCSCKASFGEEPNTHICPVCLGYPGVLPALNREALKMGAVVARALNCELSPITWFERKQYFYPDMPKNYQISQFASPLGINGWVELSSEEGDSTRRIRIKEAHLEEDAGKMIHAGGVTLLDYNRAGVSLLEVVTEPDFKTGEEAERFLRLLRRTVRYLGVSDGNMEEGSLRCDANVSINVEGAGLGRKVEIKNLNSARFVRLGLEYEIKRQSAVLDDNGHISQETRLWNENRDQTEVLRSKENANDYRYFPEPDLPPFIVDRHFAEQVESALVELPAEKEERFRSRYALSENQITLLCEERAVADYFEDAVTKLTDALIIKAEDGGVLQEKEAAERVYAWLSSDVRRLMKKDTIANNAIGSFRLTSTRLASLVALLVEGRLSGKLAKQVLELVVANDMEPEAIVKDRGWELISDEALIRKAVDQACDAEAEAFTAAVKGEAKLVSYLVGKTIAASGGRAEPNLVRRLVTEKIASAARS